MHNRGFAGIVLAFIAFQWALAASPGPSNRPMTDAIRFTQIRLQAERFITQSDIDNVTDNALQNGLQQNPDNPTAIRAAVNRALISYWREKISHAAPLSFSASPAIRPGSPTDESFLDEHSLVLVETMGQVPVGTYVFSGGLDNHESVQMEMHSDFASTMWILPPGYSRIKTAVP